MSKIKDEMQDLGVFRKRFWKNFGEGATAWWSGRLMLVEIADDRRRPTLIQAPNHPNHPAASSSMRPADHTLSRPSLA
jgi:hypothetical protein